jgi:hypothetical protein
LNEARTPTHPLTALKAVAHKLQDEKAKKLSESQNLDEFDEILLKTIDKTLRYVLGDRNAFIVYDYLEKSSCPVQEIPSKLDLFSAKLRDLLGTSRGQILGAPTILEDTIVEALSHELGLSPEMGRVFRDRIGRLKERYNSKKSVTSI